MKPAYDIKDFLEIKYASATSFSPNGNQVSVVSNLSGISQIYLSDRVGGELKQLTSYDEPIYLASFSPTENKILFGMAKGGNENTQLYLYDITTRKTHPITNKPEFKFQFGGWSRDGKYITYASNERNGTDFDVYTLNLQTSEAKCVFKAGGQCMAFGFSPKRRFLVVGKGIGSSSTELYLLDLNDNSTKLVASAEGEAENYNPRWLPSEEGFFYISNLKKDFTGLRFYDLKKNKSEYLMTSDWDIEGISITRDGKYIALKTNEDGYEKVVIYTSTDLKPIARQNLPKGTSYQFGWSNDGNFLIINVASPIAPRDAWIWSREVDKATRLTTSPNAVPGEQFVEPKLIHYSSFDGLEIPAYIYTPTKPSKGKKLPVIIDIHGGPEAQARPAFNALTQYFVLAGYVVVVPNYRGSTGYGKKFQHLDDVEKRMDTVSDIVALRKYLSKKEEIDIKKITLMGGSYGGFMVLACLAFHPELWAAGVDLVGIANFVTFLENTSPYRRANRESEYGSLKKNRKFLESISPYNFVENIKAPLFIIHGKNDPRVPLLEAEQMYAKLSGLKKRVELLVYSDEGHGLAKLKNRLDAYPKIVDFLDSSL